jgi:hypothetical protein
VDAGGGVGPDAGGGVGPDAGAELDATLGEVVGELGEFPAGGWSVVVGGAVGAVAVDELAVAGEDFFEVDGLWGSRISDLSETAVGDFLQNFFDFRVRASPVMSRGLTISRPNEFDVDDAIST